LRERHRVLPLYAFRPMEKTRVKAGPALAPKENNSGLSRSCGRATVESGPLSHCTRLARNDRSQLYRILVIEPFGRVRQILDANCTQRTGWESRRKDSFG